MLHQNGSIASTLTAVLTLLLGMGAGATTASESADGAGPAGALLPWSFAGGAVLCGATRRGGQFDKGTIFCLTAGGEERLLHSFAGGAADGAEPLPALIRGRDGDLYGVTASGGRCERSDATDRAAGCGTLFRVAADGSERPVHSFNGLIEPIGGLIQAKDGSFLGLGPDQIYRIGPDGSETVVHFFGGGKTDGSDPSGLLEADNTILYGTTRSGGAFNRGTVFELTESGDERLIHSFRGGADGDFPSAPPIQGRDGALYGTTTYGGVTANMSTVCDRGCGTVFRITLEGKETVLHAFRGGVLDGVHPTSSLAQSSDGVLYGTTSGGGSDTGIGPGTLFAIAPDGQLRLFYAFRDESEGVFPSALTQAADGGYYGTAGGGRFGQGVVFELSASGKVSLLYVFGRRSQSR